MFVLVSALVLLLTSAAFAGYQYLSFRASARERLAVRGQIIAANSTAALAFGDVAAAREILSALQADPHVQAAALFSGDGSLFATYPAVLDANVLPDELGELGYRYERGLLVGYEPVEVGGGGSLGTLYMASDLAGLYEALLSSAVIGVIVFGLSVLAAYALSRVLQGTISKPILALAEAARAVSSRQDYSLRAPQGAGGELHDLTEAFNHMLARIEAQNQTLTANEVELRRYATELEQRVAERTADLETSNESLRRNAAELMVANAELDAFAYSVSHDLRAPLRSIDGFSQIVLEDHAPKLDEGGRDALRRVRAASQRMGALIDSLLRLARISRVTMSRERVDLSDVATRVVSDLQRGDPDRQVDVSIEAGLEAWGDRRLLEVALDNLLRNSWKYTTKQPQPRIELGTTRVNGERAFMLRDNGAGFDMQYADKLFAEFQRLHSEKEFEGTGVGLATVRRIVSRHGGRIWAEGAVDQGATFYFTL
jgi:signal transduction histidine kinase